MIDQYAETDPVLTLWISVLTIAGDTDPFTVKYEINALDRMFSFAKAQGQSQDAILLANQVQFLTQVLTTH